MATTCKAILPAANACLYSSLTLQLEREGSSSIKLARLATTLEARPHLATLNMTCLALVNDTLWNAEELDVLRRIYACVRPVRMRLQMEHPPNKYIGEMLDVCNLRRLELAPKHHQSMQVSVTTGLFTCWLINRCGHQLTDLSLILSDRPETMLETLSHTQLPELRTLQVLGMSTKRGAFETLAHLLAEAVHLQSLYINCISNWKQEMPYAGLQDAIAQVNRYLARLPRIGFCALDAEAHLKHQNGPPGSLPAGLLANVNIQNLRIGLYQLMKQMEILHTVETLTVRMLPGNITHSRGRSHSDDLRLFAGLLSRMPGLRLRSLRLMAPSALKSVPQTLVSFCEKKGIRLEM